MKILFTKEEYEYFISGEWYFTNPFKKVYINKEQFFLLVEKEEEINQKFNKKIEKLLKEKVEVLNDRDQKVYQLALEEEKKKEENERWKEVYGAELEKKFRTTCKKGFFIQEPKEPPFYNYLIYKDPKNISNLEYYNAYVYNYIQRCDDHFYDFKEKFEDEFDYKLGCGIKTYKADMYNAKDCYVPPRPEGACNLEEIEDYVNSRKDILNPLRFDESVLYRLSQKEIMSFIRWVDQYDNRGNSVLYFIRRLEDVGVMQVLSKNNKNGLSGMNEICQDFQKRCREIVKEEDERLEREENERCSDDDRNY